MLLPFLNLLLESVIHTVLQLAPLFDGNIAVFIIMYLLEAYVRKYDVSITLWGKHFIGIVAGTGYIAVVILTFLFKRYSQHLAPIGLNAD